MQAPSELQQLLEDAVRDGQAPGVVAAIAGVETEQVAMVGEMTVGGAAMRRDSLFRITSITKPIAAVAALSLVQESVLHLEQSVEDLLPELAHRRVLKRPDGPLGETVPANRPITVRDLLTFTWGFGMQGAMFMAREPWPIFTAAGDRDLGTFGGPQPARTPQADEWMARLGELPLLAQPGERWLYQSGSQVLGVLLSRAAGAPLVEVLRRQVLAPLGMSDTAFHTSDSERLTSAYERRDGAFELTDPPTGDWSRPPAFADAAGGLLSSIDDLIGFSRMMLHGGAPVLEAETVAEMTRDQLTPQQSANVWPGFSFLGDRGWGYGVSVRKDGSYGWEGGSGTSWTNVPSRELGVIVLTQRAADATGMPAVCEAVLDAALSGV
jgi:CubicO group peptidase (beta-lactamase class C family)